MKVIVAAFSTALFPRGLRCRPACCMEREIRLLSFVRAPSDLFRFWFGSAFTRLFFFFVLRDLLSMDIIIFIFNIEAS